MADLRDTLEALGRCDRAADALARQSEEIPREIAALEGRIEQGREAVAAERAALEEAEHARRAKETELQDSEARRAKFRGQTALVKTNEEYAALLREIDGVTERISELEDEILGAMESVEERSARVQVRAKEQEGEEAELRRRIAELEEQLAQVKRDLEIREGEREELLTRIPEQARAQFQRVRAQRGSGTATIVSRSCSRCHRQVPWETVNRVEAGELHFCSSCQRILVPVDE